MVKKFTEKIKNILKNKSLLKKAGQILAAVLAVALITSWFLFFKKETFQGDLVFGVFSDIHASAKNNPTIADVKTKKYAETLPYFVSEMEKIKAEFTIELGDYINGTERNNEGGRKDFGLVNAIYSRLPNRYYVLGNHDVIALTKDEFRSLSGMESNYYSFEKKGYKFIVLDAQFNPEGKEMGPGIKKHIPGFIPAEEIGWLKEELEKSDKPTLIFSHQPLFSVDPSNEKMTSITNASEIKNILTENKDKVLGFFAGHNHRPAIREVDGLKYIFIPSMAYEKKLGAYAVVELSGKNMEVNFLIKGRKIKPLP